MVRARAEYLINKLIISNLSEGELDELLAGIGSNDDKNSYSAILEEYFEKLVKEHKDVPLDEVGKKRLSTLIKANF